MNAPASTLPPASSTARQKGDNAPLSPLRPLMIGCGRMGGALLSRWVGAGPERFTVVDPAPAAMPDGVRVVADAAALGDEAFDLLIVAIKPQLMDTVLPAYRERLLPGGCVLSMAAGTSTATLQRFFPEQAIVRVMPNVPVRVGRGISGLFANDRATPAHRATVDALMRSTGEALWVEDEATIDLVTAVAGSGPAYVFEIARLLVTSAETLGLPTEDARRLVLHTLEGATALALDGHRSLESLRDEVTSPGGTTAAGLAALTRDGALADRLEATLIAAHERAIELRGSA